MFSTLIISCGKLGKGKVGDRNKSKLTGWKFNDPNYGSYVKGKYIDKGTPPPGMVHIEGGAFTMGAVQDDVMSDWNTTPKKVHVRSFYLDETEVTNAEYVLFLQYTKDVYPPSQSEFKHIYQSVLPDTLVWRKGLGNNNLLSENYLRHPAYSDYPVVGVSWLQANQYCKWRTNAVNLKILMDKGVIKNVFDENEVANYKGENSFDTDAYLANPNKSFSVETAKDNTNEKTKSEKKYITYSDGVLTQKFRLPTEAEWEFAAKAIFENREYNNIRGRKKYPWEGKRTRNMTRKRFSTSRGDQLANFKQSKGNYSGITGWSDDGSDIPIAVKSYPPNAFGLYDMAGNVAEWVADVYRPIIDSDANDFNYFRGNIFTKPLISEDGKVVIVGDSDVEYDTLVNGQIVPKYLPGSVKYVPITKDDVFYKENYKVSDNTDILDGEKSSTKNYNLDDDQFGAEEAMYNSPKKPSNGLEYDNKKRTTLISNKTRVYKGGSWADKEYWLDPAQRRYLPEFLSTNYIGFRCATDKVGTMMLNKKKKSVPRYKLRR